MNRNFQKDGNRTDSDLDPLLALGLTEETCEDWVNQFFAKEESVKVKNLSTQEMPDAMKEFLSFGVKFCPVDLDFDLQQMEQDLEALYKRLRVQANYPETEDTRTEEEKRFCLRTGWAPTAGKFASLDLFIHLLKKNAESWIPPVRIKHIVPVARWEAFSALKSIGQIGGV